jgi:cell division transport system permease protein
MRRLIRAWRQGLGESWEGLWRNRGLSLMSAVSIGVSIYVIGLFLLLTFNLNRFVEALGRDIQVQIYMKDGAEADQIEWIGAALSMDPAIGEVRFVTREEAQRRFRETFPTLRDLSETIEGNPFPASFELTLEGEARDPASLAALTDRYRTAPGVEEVRYDLGWIDRLSGMVVLIRSGGFAIGALLVMAMMVTVGAVVRLTVLARREEIEIMKLVGATAAFIRGPFLLGAAVQGGAGGGLALAGLALTHRVITGTDFARSSPFLSVVGGSFLPVEAAVLLAASGALLGLVAAALALRRAGTY